VLAIPECCNINNNSTKLLSVKHTYIHCTCILHGQHVSIYHKVNFWLYIQIHYTVTKDLYLYIGPEDDFMISRNMLPCSTQVQ
jgi:hypothetical protein